MLGFTEWLYSFGLTEDFRGDPELQRQYFEYRSWMQPGETEAPPVPSWWESWSYVGQLWSDALAGDVSSADVESAGGIASGWAEDAASRAGNIVTDMTSATGRAFAAGFAPFWDRFKLPILAVGGLAAVIAGAYVVRAVR